MWQTMEPICIICDEEETGYEILNELGVSVPSEALSGYLGSDGRALMPFSNSV